MEKYKKLEDSYKNCYSCYGASLTCDGSSESSFVNAVLNLIFNIDQKLVYQLPKMLQEAIDEGARPSALIEAFVDVLEQHESIMNFESRKMLDSGCSGGTFNIAEPPKVDTKELIKIVRKLDKTNNLEIGKMIYDKAPKMSFFDQLLSDLCETIEDEDYDEESCQILEKFWMKDDLDNEVKISKSASKVKRFFDYSVNVSVVLKKIQKAKALKLGSKNKSMKDFGAQDIVWKLFTCMQELGSKKYWWRYGDVRPSEFLAFRLCYKKGEIPSKGCKDKDLEKIKKKHSLLMLLIPHFLSSNDF